MDLVLKKRIGTFAVEIDAEAGTTEQVVTDRIALVCDGPINGLTGLAQFALAFGGFDSTGRFHVDHKRAGEAAQLVITRAQLPESFDQLFCDAHGLPLTGRPESWYVMVAKDLLLPIAYKQIWGGKYPDMEVSIDGQTVFHPDMFKKPKPPDMPQPKVEEANETELKAAPE